MQENYSPWLEDLTKQFITPDIPPVPRVIVAAANYHDELDILLVGARHWSPAMRKQLDAINGRASKASNFTQGFIDQFDQFVSREEAKEIAVVNGQPLIGEDWGNQLFSENLY